MIALITENSVALVNVCDPCRIFEPSKSAAFAKKKKRETAQVAVIKSSEENEGNKCVPAVRDSEHTHQTKIQRPSNDYHKH